MIGVAKTAVGCAVVAVAFYAAGALAMLAIAIAGGATWEDWPQVMAVSVGWPVMLLMLVIVVLAASGAPH
jgi:hypothetical protein